MFGLIYFSHKFFIKNIHGVTDPSKTIWNYMFQRIQTPALKTRTFVKQFVCFVAKWAIVRGPQQLIEVALSFFS